MRSTGGGNNDAAGKAPHGDLIRADRSPTGNRGHDFRRKPPDRL